MNSEYLKRIKLELEKAEKNVAGWNARLEFLRKEHARVAAELVVKPRGRRGGRKPKLTDEQIAEAKELIKVLSISAVAAELKVSVRTLKRAKVFPPRSVYCC